MWLWRIKQWGHSQIVLASVGVSLGRASALFGAVAEKSNALILESAYPTIDEAISNRLNIYLGPYGAYLAPCGCGNENKYEATIMAIKTEKSGLKLLVGKGKITLGRF